MNAAVCRSLRILGNLLKTKSWRQMIKTCLKDAERLNKEKWKEKLDYDTREVGSKALGTL